jgi:hypothetical protein
MMMIAIASIAGAPEWAWQKKWTWEHPGPFRFHAGSLRNGLAVEQTGEAIPEKGSILRRE